MKNIWMIMTLPLLMLSACSNDTDAVTEEITLTTPVIELGEVSASASRVAVDDSKVTGATVNLYLHDSEERRLNIRGNYTYSIDSYSSKWDVNTPVTVTGGEGAYRAGIEATISLKGVNSMPAINKAKYAYRGIINVNADGSFIPVEALKSYTAAVLVKLKDANGTDIASSNNYCIKPLCFLQMTGFAADDDAPAFPNGTTEPKLSSTEYSSYIYKNSTSITANGDITPGIYPATCVDGQLVSSTVTAPWTIFEVTYCKDGFNNDGTPKSETKTTWTVNYPDNQLSLEAGKLYTFTVTLGQDSHITLDAQNAVTIAPWEEDEDIVIQVGK